MASTSPPAAFPSVEPTPEEDPSIEVLGPELREAMTGVSWRPGCPVDLADLRQVHISHWTFEGSTGRGTLIVHTDVASDVVAVFAELYRQHFPIRRMLPIHHYGATDDPDEGANDFASIEDDNTSAFNCRLRTGGSEFSEHAFGTAIDLNPIENPYVGSSGTTSHSASVPFLNRSARQGVITSEGGVENAFRDVGWGWGGNWADEKDYQHFSLAGR